MIDAALNGQGKYAGKAYFFKGNQYVRYDWNKETVDNGYPALISVWSGIGEMLKAGVAKAQAIQWILRSQPQLRMYLATLSGLPNPRLNTSLIEKALNVHFHVVPAQARSYVPAILQTYEQVLLALNNSYQSFRFRTQSEAVTDRGIDDKTGVPFPAYTFYNHSINFTVTFARFGPLCQAAMVLHEPVHYVDQLADSKNDFYEHSPQYKTITADLAIHNPSSYVCFAQHLYYGRDERYGAGRPNE